MRWARLARPGNIAAGFGGGVEAVAPVKIDPIDLTKQIGIVFIRINGGEFIYQGEKDSVNSFGIAEAPFTIGQMKKLLEIKGEEVRAIFTVPKWDIDAVIRSSKETAAKDVPAYEIDNCPLVYVNNIESVAVAKLLGKRLLVEKEWERAASGTTGLKRPWGNELDSRYAVYNDNGTRPVKSKPAGASKEGVYDLIGNVWEWLTGAYLCLPVRRFLVHRQSGGRAGRGPVRFSSRGSVQFRRFPSRRGLKITPAIATHRT